LQETNAPAYLASSSVTKKKKTFYNRSTCRLADLRSPKRKKRKLRIFFGTTMKRSIF